MGHAADVDTLRQRCRSLEAELAELPQTIKGLERDLARHADVEKQVRHDAGIELQVRTLKEIHTEGRAIVRRQMQALEALQRGQQELQALVSRWPWGRGPSGTYPLDSSLFAWGAFRPIAEAWLRAARVFLAE